MHLKYKGIAKLKIKWMQRHMPWMQRNMPCSKDKKIEVDILISDKIDFNTKNYLQTFHNNKINSSRRYNNHKFVSSVNRT